MKKASQGTGRWLQLFVVASSAAIIYQLPYLRYSYYNSMLEAFRVTNEQLGTMMSMYGLFMILFYFPGGWISDRFSNRNIMCLGLILTGAAGLLFATFPSYPIALMISIFWSATTAMLFWTCMVGVTRSLGTESEQGRLFGLLEGGRGLIATIAGLAIVPIFSHLGSGVAGLRMVILIYSVSGIVLGIISFFVIVDPPRATFEESQKARQGSFKRTFKSPAVWLITFIFFTTMNLFICLGYLTPYLTDVMGCTVALAAGIGIVRTWGLMMLGGPIGGFIADKITTSKTLVISYILIALGFLTLIVIPGNSTFLVVAVVAMMLFGFGIYVNRGIYFASLSEAGVPMELTGAATAIITAIGGSPDAFLYTIIGGWLDKYPGGQGFKYVFIYASINAACGIAASLLLMKVIRKAKARPALIFNEAASPSV